MRLYSFEFFTTPFFFYLLIAILGFNTAFSQDDNNNIIIQNAKENYSFILGDNTNPVKVIEELNTTYYCNDFRTGIRVADFCNDQIVTNRVENSVSGGRSKSMAMNYEFYTSEGIFYSDAKISTFYLPFEKKNTTSEFSIRKTILDPRYFTNIFFSDDYFVQRKEINITVPAWMKIEIKEYNFDGYSITKQVSKKGDNDVYTYIIQNAPKETKQENAPGATYILPHLLLLTKYAEINNTRITYFNKLDDQYAWYRQLLKLMNNDATTVKTKAEEITKGINDNMEKVKTIYQWVQDNIRYIAYEDGIAGFKPENAQDVLRKKYGDCKGMANLLTVMLRSLGLDARLCWLGTNHIAYDYSTPSLGVDNHLICAWLYNGKTYFLDGTETYIGFGEFAERIQGRQVLIENGDKYILQKIPVASPSQNTSYEKRTLTINGNDLTGKVVQTWKGEGKEWLLSQLHDTKKEKQEDALLQFLAQSDINFKISNLKIFNINDHNTDLKIEYDVLLKDRASTFDKETYIDLDDRKSFSSLSIDTAKRKKAFLFSYKYDMVFETELLLPQNTKAETIPNSLKIDEPEYSITGNYMATAGKINYRREVMIKQTWLPTKKFATWNNSINTLKAFYNNQLTLKAL